MSEPIYPRLLGLKHIHPNAWQRAVLGEGMVFLGFLLSPGSLDVAPWKAMLVLPVAVALVVKAHDVVTGLLGGRPQAATDADEERSGLLPAGPAPAPDELLVHVDEEARAVPVPAEATVLTPRERAEAVLLAVRLAGFAEAGEHPGEPVPEPEPHDGPTSAELWAMVEAARELSDGEELPFVLVSSPRGPVSVGADVGLLTPQERAGALRAGLEQSRPERAVLAYRAGDGVQLAAYETGRGVLVGDDLSVLTADLPPLL